MLLVVAAVVVIAAVVVFEGPYGVLAVVALATSSLKGL